MQTAFRSDETFTQAEFWRWLAEHSIPDELRCELIGGRIVMSPPNRWEHSRVEIVVAARIEDHVRRKRLGLVFGSSAGYDLPTGDTLQPDVSFIASDRFVGERASPGSGFLRIVPDLVVEVLSKSTAKRDLGEKKEIYDRCSVREYWVVDADRRSVTVFARLDTGFAQGDVFTAGRVRSVVLPGLELSIEELFADLV